MKRIFISTLTLIGVMAAAGIANAATADSAVSPNVQSLVRDVAQHNIFDPNRSKYPPINSGTQPPAGDWFSLQGTSRNDAVWAAFFNGNTSELRKTLQCGDTIGGYKITAIAADHVILAAAANKMIDLPIQKHITVEATQPK